MENSLQDDDRRNQRTVFKEKIFPKLGTCLQEIQALEADLARELDG